MAGGSSFWKVLYSPALEITIGAKMSCVSVPWGQYYLVLVRR